MAADFDELVKNIKYLMYKHNIGSVTELSKRLKIPQSTLHRISVGDFKDPKYSTLRQLADFFGISPIDLIECDLQNATPTTVVEVDGDYYSQTFTNIPVRDDVIISDGDQHGEPPASYGENNRYLRWPSYDNDAYAIKCTGMSLMPRIKEGEFVVIEPNHEITPGDEILIISTDGKPTVKTFLFERDGHYHLLPVNEDHAPIRIPKNTVETMHYVAGIAKPNLIKK
ncbi:helix-turn-helix domain-containing protein [Xenorhabdus bovienii]|uniref:S24 family peptidase n=1 Tax=Xenorhabdus bovienii TaxID=40576 RepID=UPI0023B2A3D0|nr:S24 family peptidase [Xenorhabdus bovienii]MDE9443435.1 helix-turn-helix domain-containing protein [Xenorhabdus bovienii]MDE9447755.1 helix-turn-helix domain-containing protein [Xenorhabdus bovienii]